MVRRRSAMPEEYSIARHDRSPLGDASTVWDAVAATLPGVEFHPPLGDPEARTAYYEREGFRIMLCLNPPPPVEGIYAEVRGSGDAGPTLRRLVEANGWVLTFLGGW